MTFFYWFMALLIAGTFCPSAFYMGLYVFTGEDEAFQRARKSWAYLRLFTMTGVNLLIWGHVLVAVWRLMFR